VRLLSGWISHYVVGSGSRIRIATLDRERRVLYCGTDIGWRPDSGPRPRAARTLAVNAIDTTIQLYHQARSLTKSTRRGRVRSNRGTRFAARGTQVA